MPLHSSLRPFHTPFQSSFFSDPQFKKFSMRMFFNSQHHNDSNHSSYSPNLPIFTSPSKKSSSSDDTSQDFQCYQELKLTSRRRNNMHKLIQEHKQERKKSLKFCAKIYFPGEFNQARKDVSVANMLYELQDKSQSLKLEANLLLGELEISFDQILQIAAKCNSKQV